MHSCNTYEPAQKLKVVWIQPVLVDTILNAPAAAYFHGISSSHYQVSSLYDDSFVQILFSAQAEFSARALKPNSIN
jgi:hypothetical protein